MERAGTTIAAAASQTLVVGAIGCGGRGTYLATTFARLNGVELGLRLRPRRVRARAAAKAVAKITGKAPKVVADLRRVLDDKSVDAVTWRTPDHWHAPAAILACEAGKHVYVEKPCSHNIREGQLLVEAARAHNRVVQHGTQSRSSADRPCDAIELLHEGPIGDVLVAKASNVQKRDEHRPRRAGRAAARLRLRPLARPRSDRPLPANRHHYTWHWWYAFGTGDMGNDGVHELDIARWGLGVDGHPSTVVALGGKYVFDDDQQFPDTQTVVFEYPGDGKVGHRRQLIFEQRIWSPYQPDGFENGNAFYGTEAGCC